MFEWYAKGELKLQKQISKENIEEVINSMSPKEYDVFMKSLIKKVDTCEKKIGLLKNKKEKLEKLPSSRTINDSIWATSIFVSTLGTTTTCIVLSILAKNEALNFLPNDIETVTQSIASWEKGIPLTLTGALIGYYSVYFALSAYEEKPLSNLLRKIRIDGLNKKIEELESKKDMLNKLSHICPEEDGGKSL